jgi:hypothetical protein
MIRSARIADGQSNAQQSTLRGNEGLWDVFSARHAARQELPSTYGGSIYHGQLTCNVQSHAEKADLAIIETDQSAAAGI